MEVTSPGSQGLYDDIELDFDDGLYDGGEQLQDEQMLTDGEPIRPASATDDMMDDDDVGDVAASETEMQDTPDVEQHPLAPQEDEELIDYSDDEPADQPQVEDVAVQDVDELEFAHQQGDGVAPEEVEEDITRQSVVVAAGPPSAVALSELAEGAASEEVTYALEQEDVVYDDQTGYAFGEAAFEVADELDQTLIGETGVDDAHDEDTFREADLDQPAGHVQAVRDSLAVDTSVHAPVEAPGTPTDTGLHPMTIHYGEYVMPLFKSKRQLDGLLKDDNLASLSLAELMRNCRQRLALKIGNVPEDQELTLAFDHMGLSLAENSRAAFTHSLNDVLETYLQLHHNDGTQDVPALSLTLSHQQFSDQLALLQQAAANGKGLYDFVPPVEDGEQDYGQEDTEENSAEYHLHAAQVEEEQQEQSYQDGEDFSGQEYTHDEEEVEHEYPDDLANGLQRNVEAGEHADNELVVAAEAANAPEASFDETFTAAEDAANLDAGDAVEVANPAADGDDGEEELVMNSADIIGPAEVESPTSSPTVQGDHANGEHEEDDLIDWDDDSDLTSPPSELPADGHDDFSAFLADYEAEQAGTSNEPAAEQADDSHDAADINGPASLTEDAVNGDARAQLPVADDSLQQQILGSEDFLNDFDEHEHDGNAVGEQHQEHQGEEDLQDEDHNDQADTFNEQQYEHLANKEDAQYHTAHSVADGESYEHGLEHEPEGQNGDLDYAHDTEVSNKEDNLFDDLLDGENQEHSPETYAPQNGQSYSPLDPEDDIDFDDDTTEQHEARKASQHELTTITPGSPLGKRSFDEHVDEGELDFDDEPEVKRVRSQ
ncbi:hypothetical protein LTR08_000920 [Meristemomyces frigidus]|nr:hypothetical protein LTR08_000920 [Meristemomyces frigidus]